jgi:protein TonB
VIPPEPPPIEKIRHPGVPVVGDIDADVTIADNTDLYDTRELLAGPPPLARNAGAEIDAFMPRDVNPVLRNTREVQRLLERTYPPLLRDAGIGGTVQVWFYIDESGTVRQTRLHASSGYAALDRAALDVADAMEFGPAMLRARPVPVWVSIPIVFTAR